MMTCVKKHTVATSVASAALVVFAVTAVASAQSKRAAAFVSNNGNLEGSVTALSINDDATLTFVNRVVTGSRPTTVDPCAGCNAYEIAVSPNGRYVAAAHAAGDLDGISVHQVASNGALSFVTLLTLPIGLGTPGDVTWIDNQYLATTRTDTTPDRVVVYRFNPGVPSLTEVDSKPGVSSQLFYVAADRVRRLLYAGESSGNIHLFSVDGSGLLTPVQTTGTPILSLEIVINPARNWLYAGCGIGGSGRDVLGYSIGMTGTLTALPGMPFTLTGGSTAHVAFSGDSSLLVVGGGSSGDVTSYTLDQMTGVPTYTGNTVDIGITGDIGDVQMLRDLMFVTRTSSTPRGIRSYKLSPVGAFFQNGAQVDTQGIAPRSIATWLPVLGNLNCDLAVDVLDVEAFVLALIDPAAYGLAYTGCSLLSGDFDGDGLVNGDDVQAFVTLLLAP